MTATEPMTAPVPSFDDDEDSGRKLVFICSKGSLDMAYPGLLLANAALAEGIETHIFFTFWGFDIINKKTMGELKFTALANPATHMPNLVMGLPGMTAVATRMMRKQLAELDIPDVPELLDLIVDAGGHLWACKMSADMNDLELDDLHAGVEGIINTSDFIDLSAGAQTLFI
jgi:peroxiredoxin family protein